MKRYLDNIRKTSKYSLETEKCINKKFEMSVIS